MEVILRVVDGPETGKEFRFKESDNFLIGRQDPTSKANLNVSPEDRYVSRHHFTIEVRPPNVMIRDSGSTNGTFVRAKGQKDWSKRIDEVLVTDGCQIKIGHTVLSVEIVLPEPVGLKTIIDDEVSLPAKEEQPAPQAAAPQKPDSRPLKKELEMSEALCIRCMQPLEQVPDYRKGSFQQDDFMCAKCCTEVQVEREREAAAQAAARYICYHCHCDVTQMANKDGRAAELKDVALYLCSDCAERSTKIRITAIGDYRPLSELGRGGMGVVYKAWHPTTGRLVALKQMLPIANANKGMSGRFIREAVIMQGLKHPDLVRLYEAGLEGEHPYIVSEFITDGDFSQFLSPESRPILTPVKTAVLMVGALNGLEHLHKKGFVHRDIKPENILLRKVNDCSIPKITDFGLARSYEKHGGTITRKGEYAGTLFYMPYEQIIAFKESHPPVDIYAMGVTLYLLLTGRFPLDFPSLSELKRGAVLKKDPIRMILEDTPHPVRERRPDLPPVLCAIVDHAVAREAKNRFQTAKDFRAELAKFAGC